MTESLDSSPIIYRQSTASWSVGGAVLTARSHAVLVCPARISAVCTVSRRQDQGYLLCTGRSIS